MTLQNGLIHRDKAYLWTDEGYFDGETGKLLFLDSKALKSLTWPYALSISSNGGNPHEILHDVRSAAPVDLASLLSAVSDALRTYALKGFTATVLVAAWEGEPHLFYVSTIDRGPKEPAFQPDELLHCVCSGQQLTAYHEAVAAGLTPESMANVIDAQIEAPFKLEGLMGSSGERIWFGGGVVQIEVSRDGVRDRVIRMVDGGTVG